MRAAALAEELPEGHLRRTSLEGWYSATEIQGQVPIRTSAHIKCALSDSLSFSNTVLLFNEKIARSHTEITYLQHKTPIDIFWSF